MARYKPIVEGEAQGLTKDTKVGLKKRVEKGAIPMILPALTENQENGRKE